MDVRNLSTTGGNSCNNAALPQHCVEQFTSPLH